MTTSLWAAIAIALSCAARLLAVRVLVTLAASGAPIAVALLMKTTLDRLVLPGSPVLAPVLLLATAMALMVLLPEVGRYIDGQLQRAVNLHTRTRLYQAVNNFQGLRRFEDPRFHDRLMLAAETGPQGPSEVVISSLGIASGAVVVSGFLVTIGLLNPWLLLVICVAAIPAMRAELRLSQLRAGILTQLGHSARREFFYANLMTSLTAVKEVRLYGLGQLFGGRMVSELRRINHGYQQIGRRELWVQAVHGLIGAAVAGGGLVWAVLAAQSGQLSIGDVSMFVAAIAGVQGGITSAINYAGRLHAAMLLFAHYRFVVDGAPDLTDEGQPVGPLRHGIELRDVWFRYNDDLPWVLRGVNLTIPAGQAVALVGHNGAGKSTLVKLLCRFYSPTRGSITWDGVDLGQRSIVELRERVSAVFQDFMHYEISAAENIGVGDVSKLDDQHRIEAAAKMSGSHDTLSRLPQGYATMLTRIYMDADDRDEHTTGVELSGGQWQRIALARALFRRDSDLLILDEPSSGLDPEAEYELRARLNEHRAGRTSLLISHRLGAVRDADMVVVLSDGVIAEQGSHDELIESEGTYSRLFDLQAEGYRA